MKGKKVTSNFSIVVTVCNVEVTNCMGMVCSHILYTLTSVAGKTKMTQSLKEITSPNWKE